MFDVVEHVRNNLNHTMRGGWTERGAPTAWPARSPDLTPLFFFSWGGYERNLVYKVKYSYLGTAYSDLLFQIIIKRAFEVTPCLIRRLPGA